VRGLVHFVRNAVPPGGRVLFAGATVHFYGRGHVAFLPCLTGREMMACDYYAFPPGTVEYNYPPRAYRLKREDTLAFMDLYNVTHVVTYHEDWRRYFLDQPERYQPLLLPPEKNRAYCIFKVKRTPDIFLKGSGTVTADFNRIRVDLDAAREEVVIKYNWCDDLRVSQPAEIFPHKAWKDINLIGIRPNGAQAVDIRYGGWL
jgi:hypothetical protein